MQHNPPNSGGSSSPTPQMLSLEEARSTILRHAQPLPAQPAPVQEAVGQIIAQPVHAPIAVPPFATSAMDGYALRAADISAATPESPAALTATTEIGAGDAPSEPLPPGGAARIMTGAAVPQDADCVVPIEHVATEGDRVIFTSPAQPGTHIRAAGNDIQQDEAVLPAGESISPGSAGVLASLGIAEVQVHRRPRVAIISTGKELTPAGQPLKPGHIHDSNTPALSVAVRQCGAEPLPQPTAEDTLEGTVNALRSVARCDLIITSGGVSVGDHDFVKEAIAELGEVRFWKVRVRPGKPLVYGAIAVPGAGNIPVIGLPGNPVSALVSFFLFCRPLIRKLQGAQPSELARVKAVLDGEVANHDSREVYARVVLTRIHGELHAKPLPNQSSGALKSLAHADGLAICPADVPRLNPGDTIEVAIPMLPEAATPLLQT